MEHLKPSSANSSPLTTIGFLDRTATVYGDCPSIIYNDTIYTWSQTRNRCIRLASALSSIGISSGDVVSVVAPNIPAMYEMHFGIPMCGAILNTINIRLDSRTISVLLRHSHSKLVFVDIQSRPLIEQAIKSLTNPPRLIIIEDEHRVTHLCGAPVVLNMLANAPDSDRKQLPNPVQILTAGAPPPAAVLFRTEALGFSVSHGYGLTETAGLVVSCAWKGQWNRLPATERARLKARQGVRTLCMTEVAVVDGKTGKGVKRDGSTLGEIVLRGGGIFLGYLKDPEGTANSLKNGWFYTGDVGVMHPDGYLEIRDRSKDVIISGGENLSSVEVESVLYSHPAINEGAVVARPDEFWGETPCAFVSLKEEFKEKQPSEKEIIAFCRERLPHYMVPKTVVTVAELPKTSTGKIQKFVLRDMAKGLGPLPKASRL
ncbi:hypothetical protein AAC387_Pa01g0470 [Persea americana]